VPRFTKSDNKTKGVIWNPAPDIDKRLSKLVKKLSIDWIKKEHVFSVRSSNTKTRAYARIWGLGRIWQIVLKENPKYIIEVISERFDRLGERQKDGILLHEIAHIPRNFSGSLVPHFRSGKRRFKDRVRNLVVQYNNLIK
jgi:predicted metallopeptidase